MEAGLANLALLVGGAGIAIILFTIVIRLVLAPLQIVQLRSARAMQRLQPHIQELRKKHGKDRQKMTEETMKLYKEHKVNPAMGCLPMLLQFPVLIGLFWALRGLGSSPSLTATAALIKRFPGCWSHAAKAGSSYLVSPSCWDRIKGYRVGHWLHHTYHYSPHVYALYHAHFLWLSNGLGQPDPLFILPVLAGVTQWIQSRMMMQQSSDPQQQTMNMMMNFTPLIIVFFATRYASGLSLYWVTSTIIGILLSAKITGWGSLPRIDQMILRPRPATGIVSSKPRSRQAPSPSPAVEMNGGDGGKAIEGPSGAAADGTGTGANGSSANGGGSKAANRQNARRRSGKPRGGRRG